MIDIIVKALIDRGSDREQRIRIELNDGLGEHVSGRVPEDLFPLGIVEREDAYLRVFPDRTVQIEGLTIDADRERVPRKSFTDARCDIKTGRIIRIVARRTVGQGYGDHLEEEEEFC